MLSIFYGDMPDAIYNPVLYFKNTYTDEWIMDDLSKKMIREYYESGEGSGIELRCRKECRVLAGKDWKRLLEGIYNSIVFIDEDNAFLPTREFAEAVRESDNYYVIVTREGLPNLPYSVEEIYGIRESGKYASLKQT